MTQAYVLLLNLIGSSNLSDRQAATESVQAAQTAVTERFPGIWLAPLETTRGDETAAVLSAPGAAYDVIAAMGDAIHPLGLSAVVEYGELVAGLDTGRASIIDGPAFHRADEAMDRLKEGSALCLFDTGEPDLDRPLTALGNLLLNDLADLTELQRRVLRHYQEELRQGAKAKQEVVGEAVGRSQQHVSRTLKAIRWDLIDDGEAVMRELLSQVAQRHEGAGEGV